MRLIFLHGPAASGKLTVARELARLTGYRLFHNHLIVDALTAAFDFGSQPFAELREEFWLRVFAESARAGRSLIFTFAPERTVRPRFIPDAVAAVGRHGGQVCFAALTVSDAEQERRVGEASRRAHGKLASATLLRELRAQGAFAFPPLPDDGLTIDTGTTAPVQAAARIAAHFGLA
ncbi:MAG TPA: hypothetical protein VMH86_02655 [Rhizomicrobium sp.]|nr:hypothetical protein [Rhizomicrobium sp.]